MLKVSRSQQTAKNHNFSTSPIFPDMPGFELSEKLVSMVSELMGIFLVTQLILMSICANFQLDGDLVRVVVKFQLIQPY